MKVIEEEPLIVFLFGGGAPEGIDVKTCISRCEGESSQFDCLLEQCNTCEFNPNRNPNKPCMLWKRLRIARALSKLKTRVLPIIFEFVLFRAESEIKLKPIDVFVDVLEDLEVQSVKENSIIIVFPESTGSITEFVHYASNESTRKIVRVIVDAKYNPYYSRTLSFLSAYYLRFAGLTGHLYVANTNNIDELELLAERIVQAEIKNRIIQRNLNNSKHNSKYGGIENE